MLTEENKILKLTHQIQNLESLLEALRNASSYLAKIAILDALTPIKDFFFACPSLKSYVNHMEHAGQFAIKSLAAIGQGPVVFQDFDKVKNILERLNTLARHLLEIEKFYDTLGGIIGYHLILLKLLSKRGQCEKKGSIDFRNPPEIDISEKAVELNAYVRAGIESMPLMAEMYPIGGAGDRLNLKDEKTNEPLPAAQLLFCGRTLLESLIRDLQGREFLYYKLFGKQLVTPLAIMTSEEKNNHQRILELIKAKNWFGRSRESYRFFKQPLVPMVNQEGEWMISSPLQLVLKPGGHGVIWKAALDEGIFDWLDEKKRKKILVRQINNPIAGIDSGLLAFVGIGCQRKKDFGFASCYRLIGSSEGMNVLREVKNEEGFTYCITNIEYTDFKQYGIEDAAERPGSPYSRFPANTNILFGDLAAIKNALTVCPIPGMIINLKSNIACYENGPKEKMGGRLESTMQNIADFIVDHSSEKLLDENMQDLRTYLTYNTRMKTISVAKQAYEEQKPWNDTPEKCFYDLMNNYRDLLINYCQMNLPLEQKEENYKAFGPDCIILFHPSLGGLYSILAQKIQGGKLAKGSEWILEISEAHIINLDLEGSLIVEADCIMGKEDQHGLLKFNSEHCGKCNLIDLRVRNQGREMTSFNEVWKMQYARKEALRITLHGNAEFFAENVTLEGDVHFDVPEGHRLVVYQQGDEIAWHLEKFEKPSWKWDYYIEEDSSISVEKKHVTP